MPLPLALAAAPGLIPVLWYEAIRELFPRQLEDFYPASALFVAAATGVIAWLAARPFLKLSRLAERAWVQRKAPLFLLMALVLWGAVLTLVSGASRSFPTRGAMRTLDFSCLRLPQSAGEATSPEAALESLWQQKVEEEFGRDRAAITAPDENYTRGNPNNPLCKYWRFTFVGTSGEVTEARLIRLAENMIAALPEIARGSATLSIYSSLGRRDSGTLYLRGENAFAFIGILMTLGGWFASLTRGRPIFNGAVPWLMVLIVSAAHLAPSQNLPGAVDVPAPDPPGGVALPHLALERLRELEKSEAEPETSALYRWIDACRRLDRAAAAALSKRRLEDHEWQHLVGFWQNNLPLSISRDLSPGRADRPGVPFVCVVVPAARPGAGTPNNYRTYYHPFYEARDAIQSTSVTLTVTKDGDTWQVEQYP